jgi:hypothetical protein
MERLIKKFNNIIKKTIFKLKNKTNNKLEISTFNKYIITIISILFAYIFYLLTPLLYDKNWIQNKILTNLSDEFSINLSDSLDISYRILPKPHYLIKDNKTDLAEIKVLNVFISQNNFFNKDKIRINKVVIENANFSLSSDNFKMLYESSYNKFSKQKIKVINSNIFLKDNLNEVISIIKVSNALLFFDEDKLFNIFDLKGKIFNIPFKLISQNIIDSKNKIEIKLPSLELEFINEFFKVDKNSIKGKNDILILGSLIKTKYDINDNVISFESDGSKVYNYKLDYNGQLAINPFDLKLKIRLDNFKIFNLFKSNSVIYEFVRSGLLFNKNISLHTLVNIKSKKKSDIFSETKLELRSLNGKINFDKSVFINKDIGLIKISNSDLFLENNKLILTANLSIDIKDSDRLYSFLNTNKRLRKDIKNIKLNITYDFLSNEIVFQNINIDDNKVSEQFYNIVKSFSDTSSNNLTKSRRLLNELISLYEG